MTSSKNLESELIRIVLDLLIPECDAARPQKRWGERDGKDYNKPNSISDKVGIMIWRIEHNNVMLLEGYISESEVDGVYV